MKGLLRFVGVEVGLLVVFYLIANLSFLWSGPFSLDIRNILALVKDWPQLGMSILTLVVTICIAYFAYRISKQNYLTSIRPVVLSEGGISFEAIIAGHANLILLSLTYGATNISGYIIFDKTKYELMLFTTGVSGSFPVWGWLPADKDLRVAANVVRGRHASLDRPNQIYLVYSDVLGKRYYSREVVPHLRRTTGELNKKVSDTTDAFEIEDSLTL